MLDAPHGVVNGVLLPHVIRYNGAGRPERFVPIAPAGLRWPARPRDVAAEMLAEQVRELGDDVGVPARARRARRQRRRTSRGCSRATLGRRVPGHEPAQERPATTSRRCSGWRCERPRREPRRWTAARRRRDAARPRGADRGAVGQAVLLPRVRPLRRADAPGGAGDGLHLAGGGAHHARAREALLQEVAAPPPSTWRRSGWCWRWPTASCRTRARGSSCAAHDGDRRRRRARTCTPTGCRHGRGPPTARDASARRPGPPLPARADDARRPRGRRVRRAWTSHRAGDRRHDLSVLRILANQAAASLQNSALLPRRPAARRARPARPRTSRPATTELPAHPGGCSRPASARCSTPSATASPASCTTA